MSFLSKRPKTKKVVSAVAEAVEYGAAGYAFGYVQNKYREKASLFGQPVDLLSAVALKGAALGCHLLNKGASLACHANAVGNAALVSYTHTLGAGHGAQAGGVARIALDKKDVPKAKAALASAGASHTVLGEIPRAPHGDFLSAAELAELAK